MSFNPPFANEGSTVTKASDETTTSGTDADVTDFTVTFTPRRNGRAFIFSSYRAACTVNNNGVIKITDSANVLLHFAFNSQDSAKPAIVKAIAVITNELTAGTSYTFKLRFATSGGVGNLTIKAGSIFGYALLMD